MNDDTYRPEEILKLEFEYANKTAEQAQDDRATIINLYLLLVGGVGSIIVGLGQSSNFDLPRGVYAIVFGLLGIIGFFILFQLVRLRQAWYDSALTMNRIKDFYVAKFPALADALHWRTTTIPPLGKWWTITFNLAALVAVIDSVAIGVAVFILNPRVAGNDFIVPVVVTALYFSFQIAFYYFQLSEK